MPAYSYKERFCPFVMDGTKPGTIRGRRKDDYAPKPGDPLYHFFGLRTKFSKRLGQSTCKFVKTILIDCDKDGNFFLYVFDKRLGSDAVKTLLSKTNRKFYQQILLHCDIDKDRLAWQDGFRPEGSTLENPAGSWDLMCQWWSKTNTFPFVGDWIMGENFSPEKANV